MRGFTLLEIVAVLVLLGVAATLVLPSFTRGLRGIQLEAAARDLVTRMKQARSRAITRQKVFRIILDQETEQKAYYVLADEFRQPIKSYPLPDQTRVLSDDDQLPIVVSFYANGRSSGGRFSLNLLEGRRLVIDVDPITGFGRVENPNAPIN